MPEPKTYFLILQSVFLASLLYFSATNHRQGALILFLAFMVWKLYSRWRLPGQVFSQLSNGRLIHQRLQSGFQNSSDSVNSNKTKLYKLKAHWPSLLICQDNGAQLVIHPLLAQKLTDHEIQILSHYYSRLKGTSLPLYGTLFYGFTEPWCHLGRWLRKGIPAKLHSYLSVRNLLLKVLSFAFAPLHYQHEEVLFEVCEKFGDKPVMSFLDKLYHLRLSHNAAPPISACYLELHPHLSRWKHQSLHGSSPFQNEFTKGISYV